MPNEGTRSMFPARLRSAAEEYTITLIFVLPMPRRTVDEIAKSVKKAAFIASICIAVDAAT